MAEAEKKIRSVRATTTNTKMEDFSLFWGRAINIRAPPSTNLFFFFFFFLGQSSIPFLPPASPPPAFAFRLSFLLGYKEIFGEDQEDILTCPIVPSSPYSLRKG
ncbi:hypothetical protein MLD38_002477 [Melastoma candidum]|uniref:Uncharacterized protein n=1 Tax=Melastoma candidum TaxID=119954 RepID=A0ACB9S375_9MYRT|nr:hypothetical protein MLD38_002477 [Melastoma candidum]